MNRRIVLIEIILVLLLVILVGVNFYAGAVNVSVKELIQIVFGYQNQSVVGKIIWEIRIPRVIAAIFLGGALALSGYLLQRFFSNEIAGPYVLGISSGAKLIVAILMVVASSFGFGISSIMMVVAAFAGAIAVTGVVILAAARVKNMSVLIVCGVMIGYICSAITELLVSFAADSNIVNLHNWSLGSFSGISWSNVANFVPVIVIGLIIALFMAKAIEAYSYGEDYAKSLGMHVRLFRVVLILISSLLSATVTAFAGPISFVGIAVPHVVMMLCKTQRPKVLIPTAFLGGAVFCLFSDLLARCLFAPMELSISTITAIFGAPIVISMLLRRKRG